ncbi:3-keto-5-aminohexanoate cleavage protein [Natrinema sp. 1APR25-10V2]|uniref:3-keto-5-aminohexanoate cleavage protein n=1 Tax=Natrinema sp. 1APR25-10V2 TaxID=2951081 RepID=UPI0028763479|nr:3-keto-5-aminohexanoate cleavage protein [Natrinema sp. 1APR25-10V2]MDS0476966.1 3-keto-5-aminohexanoate cleavage protein [Natrinema sp. 1APR25-10V2]
MTLDNQESIKGNDSEKAIISAALTGALTTRDQCEAIPYTPEEIAEDAAAAREAGASIAHIHARTDNGEQTFDTEIYQEIYDEIRDRTDILINFSTGAMDVPPEERMDYLREVQPDIAALNMGSMNYAKYSESRDDFVFNMVFENSFDDIRKFVRTMNESGVKPELECFDTGHIGNIRPLLKTGELEHPLQFSLIMGVLGGIPATVENLTNQVRQLPSDANWQVIGISEDQWPLAAAALSMGGNVRVGLEDNFYLPNGEMATNPELVEKAAELTRNVGREPATPDEARKILGME